jgi:hypothetical protein
MNLEGQLATPKEEERAEMGEHREARSYKED